MRKCCVVAAAILAVMVAIPAFSANAGEKYRVAYVARTLADQFAAWLATEMKNAADKNSDILTLEVLDAQADNEKQNTIIETCIAQKYDCIIVQPNDGELQRPYVQKALDAGIFCITTNAKIPDLPGSSSVDADPYEQGAVLARDGIKRVPQNARAVVMSCNPGNLHTTSRMQAYHDIFFKARPDVKLLAEVVLERADEGIFMATFEDWVQSYGEIDVIYTIGDALALSSLEVVKDNPKFKNLIAYGVDAIPDALLAIKGGRYTATVMQNCVDLAELNMKAARQLLTGEKKVVEYEIPAILIDKSNVDQYIAMYLEYGLLKQEEVDKVK